MWMPVPLDFGPTDPMDIGPSSPTYDPGPQSPDLHALNAVYVQNVYELQDV